LPEYYFFQFFNDHLLAADGHPSQASSSEFDGAKASSAADRISQRLGSPEFPSTENTPSVLGENSKASRGRGRRG